MEIRLFDSEFKVLDLIWDNQPIGARQISELVKEKYGWKINTTYTVISKILKKGYIRREEPGYICVPVYSREEVRRAEARGLVDRFFDGSRKALFSALLEEDKLTEAEREELRRMIEKE